MPQPSTCDWLHPRALELPDEACNELRTSTLLSHLSTALWSLILTEYLDRASASRNHGAGDRPSHGLDQATIEVQHHRRSEWSPRHPGQCKLSSTQHSRDLERLRQSLQTGQIPSIQRDCFVDTTRWHRAQWTSSGSKRLVGTYNNTHSTADVHCEQVTGLLCRYLITVLKYRYILTQSAQVFEGTTGIDVKKVAWARTISPEP